MARPDPDVHLGAGHHVLVAEVAPAEALRGDAGGGEDGDAEAEAAGRAEGAVGHDCGPVGGERGEEGGSGAAGAGAQAGLVDEGFVGGHAVGGREQAITGLGRCPPGVVALQLAGLA